MSRSTLRGSAITAEIRKAQAAAATPVDPKAAKKNAKDKAVDAAPKGAGEIRIIGGQWKRTRLPVAQRPGLRPTPDRVRETLFNWLGQDLAGWRCLDAFAGTGALGLEAASRGAASVLLVENDAALVAQLQVLQAKLQASAVRVQRGDGVSALKQATPASLDLVLLASYTRLPTTTPPMGTAPLVMPLAQDIRSGVTPKAWAANGAPTREKPVITSSKINRMPCCVHSSRRRCR